MNSPSILFTHNPLVLKPLGVKSRAADIRSQLKAIRDMDGSHKGSMLISGTREEILDHVNALLKASLPRWKLEHFYGPFKIGNSNVNEGYVAISSKRKMGNEWKNDGDMTIELDLVGLERKTWLAKKRRSFRRTC